MTATAQSDVGRLELVLVKHPRDAWKDQATVDAQWRELGYTGQPDFPRAVDEFDRFVAQLRGAHCQVGFLPADDLGLDSIYVRDAAVVTDAGAVLGRMGKAARRGEPGAQRAAFTSRGIPILGEIGGGGTLEGGDVVWLDERTLAVGHGYRTNASGIEQLRALLPTGIEVVVVPLPHFRGPDDVFHLMSIVSPLDRDLALVHSPLLPVPFRAFLLERGFELVEFPMDEWDSLGGNCLALAPRLGLLPAGNPVTRARLEAAGCEVIELAAEEIATKGCGGPTCLTRPLRRRSARE